MSFDFGTDEQWAHNMARFAFLLTVVLTTLFFGAVLLFILTRNG